MNEDDLNEMMLTENLPPDHRSGYVAIVGKPNAGKSTLLNAYLGQKVAIVSEKPQTTRNRLLGILTLNRARGDLADAQVILIDTPGIHRPRHKLGEYLVETAVSAIPDADVVVFMADVSDQPGDEDRQIAGLLHKCKAPVLLVLNKTDLLAAEQAAANAQAYRALGRFDEVIPISALKGDNLDRLLDDIVEYLPLGPRYYPDEEVTDQQMRFMAAELIREQALHHLRQEVPHALAVVVQDFKERNEEMTYISANILVERDTQKAIILGQGGAMIKRIGQAARREIEDLVGTQVYLELWVKVKKGWRKDERELRRLGYEPPE